MRHFAGSVRFGSAGENADQCSKERMGAFGLGRAMSRIVLDDALMRVGIYIWMECGRCLPGRMMECFQGCLANTY